MDATEVLTLIGSAVGLSNQLADTVGEAKARSGKQAEKMAQVQQLAISLRSELLQIQEVALRLQAENAELRAQIRQNGERATEREQYETRQIGQDAAVVRKGESAPLYCPNCFDAGKLTVLGSAGMGDDMPSHVCGVCESFFQLR